MLGYNGPVSRTYQNDGSLERHPALKGQNGGHTLSVKSDPFNRAEPRKPHGSGSKLNHQGTAGFSPCFHYFGYLFSSHSHMKCKVPCLRSHEVSNACAPPSTRSTCGCGSKPMVFHFGVGAPPILELILVVGLNRMFTGGEPIWVWTHGHVALRLCHRAPGSAWLWPAGWARRDGHRAPMRPRGRGTWAAWLPQGPPVAEELRMRMQHVRVTVTS